MKRCHTKDSKGSSKDSGLNFKGKKLLACFYFLTHITANISSIDQWFVAKHGALFFWCWLEKVIKCQLEWKKFGHWQAYKTKNSSRLSFDRCWSAHITRINAKWGRKDQFNKFLGFVVCIILECLVFAIYSHVVFGTMVKSFLQDGFWTIYPITPLASACTYLWKFMFGSLQNEKFKIGAYTNKTFCLKCQSMGRAEAVHACKISITSILHSFCYVHPMSVQLR